MQACLFDLFQQPDQASHDRYPSACTSNQVAGTESVNVDDHSTSLVLSSETLPADTAASEMEAVHTYFRGSVFIKMLHLEYSNSLSTYNNVAMIICLYRLLTFSIEAETCMSQH